MQTFEALRRGEDARKRDHDAKVHKVVWKWVRGRAAGALHLIGERDMKCPVYETRWRADGVHRCAPFPNIPVRHANKSGKFKCIIGSVV